MEDRVRAALRLASTFVLTAAVCAAQVAAPTESRLGPPSCPVEPGGRPASITPGKRPTAEQIKETAEQGAADPTVMVAAEPVPNFGTERYRLADYAECVGTGGC